MFLVTALVAVSLVATVGCSKTEAEVPDEPMEIIGTSGYLSNLSSLRPLVTKAGEVSVEEIEAVLEPALSLSKSYLQTNGYDYSEDFESDDFRIIWVATALAEYDKLYANATKTSVGGCVLEAIGINEILKAAGNKLVKVIAKQALKKVLPYVGIALTAADFIMCITE